MFLLTFHYNFVCHRYVKSHAIPDIVYVPTKWSLRFYAAQYTKSHAILTHVAYGFEYISTLPLSHMLLTLLRLTTKKNYKSYPLVMKPVGPYRNIKNVALFSQADTKLISLFLFLYFFRYKTYFFIFTQITFIVFLSGESEEC